MEQIQNIATRLIQRSPLNPRKTFDEDGIKELAAKAAAKLRKKQDKIEKELTKLGYDTEGKKLDF